MEKANPIKPAFLRRKSWKIFAYNITFGFILSFNLTFALFGGSQQQQYIKKITMASACVIIKNILQYKFEKLADTIVFLQLNIGAPIIFYACNDSHFIFVGVSSMPVLTLFLTQRKPLTIISLLLQIANLKTFKEILMEHPEQVSTDENSNFLIGKILTMSTISLAITSFFFYQVLESEKLADEEKQKAQQSAAQLNQFIQTFSHELRNPLNTLQGSLAIAFQEKNDPSKIEEHINTALMCTTIIQQFINNILDSGKNDVGKLEVDKQPVILKDTLQNIWTIFTPLLKSKNLYGKVKINLNVPQTLYLDKTRISQVIMNLLSNAQKFTKRGNIIIQIEWISNATKVLDSHFQSATINAVKRNNYEAKSSNIETLILDEGKKLTDQEVSYDTLSIQKHLFTRQQVILHQKQFGILQLSVSDTGSGMSQENLSKLFQRFSQVSNEVSKRQGGSGLGLNITREIVRKLDGDIKVFSKEKIGSQFIVCIPTYYEPEFELESIKNSEQSQKIKVMKLKCMISNDNQQENALLQKCLDILGIEVLKVCTVHQQSKDVYKKLVSCQNKTVDLIFLKTWTQLANAVDIAKKIRNSSQKCGVQNSLHFLFLGQLQDHLYIKENGDKVCKLPLNILNVIKSIKEIFSLG